MALGSGVETPPDRTPWLRGTLALRAAGRCPPKWVACPRKERPSMRTGFVGRRPFKLTTQLSLVSFVTWMILLRATPSAGTTILRPLLRGLRHRLLHRARPVGQRMRMRLWLCQERRGLPQRPPQPRRDSTSGGHTRQVLPPRRDWAPCSSSGPSSLRRQHRGRLACRLTRSAGHPWLGSSRHRRAALDRPAPSPLLCSLGILSSCSSSRRGSTRCAGEWPT